MDELKGIIKGSYNIGEKIIEGCKYQLLFFLYLLRGGIIFGLFPSIAAVFQSLYTQIRDKQTLSAKEFSLYYKKHFKISNQLGFTSLSVLLFLWIDLRISAIYIQQPILHFFLLCLFIFILGASLYLFSALTRYELSYFQYLQRAFLLFFCNLIETIAILFGLYLSSIVLALFPALFFIAAVPIYGLPIVWFGLQAMEKAEKKAARL